LSALKTLTLSYSVTFINYPEGAVKLNSDQHEKLMEKTSNLISEKEYNSAKEILQNLLPQTKGKNKNVIANNLATIEYARGNIKQALSLLEPYLVTGSAVESPYSFALAAQLYARLARRKEAEHFLNQAVKVFEGKLPSLRKENTDPHLWYEYTIQLMRAACILKEKRQSSLT
jgi:tetratricopeptide (TPR) repeat protein